MFGTAADVTHSCDEGNAIEALAQHDARLQIRYA
jgi:hypothetical protein